MRALTLIACRLLAVFCVLDAIGRAPDVVLTWIGGPRDAQAFLAMLLAHVDVPLLPALGLLLWFGAGPLSRFAAGVAPLPTSSGRELAPHLVRFCGAVLVLLSLVRLVAALVPMLLAAPLPLLSLAVTLAADLSVLAAGGGLIVGAASVSHWLGGGVGDDAAPGPLPRDDASLGALIGDLVGAAGLLGVRRVSELAMAVRSEAEDVARRVVRSSLDRVIAAVEQRHPDFSAATAADGTVTIVFSDMEGFTAMTERLGDQAAHEVIKVHNRIVRRAVQKHDGQEVELQGDGFLLAFPDAAQALRCTIAIQQECAKYSARHAQTPIRVRIGVHCGTPIKEGDRFFGITVILAARIAGQAAGGEVLVSDDVRAAVGEQPGLGYSDVREAELKGITGSQRMHVLAWSAA